jgi:MFS family permease
MRSVGLRRTQLSFGGMWASEWAATVALSVVAYRDGGPAAVALVAVLRMLPAAIVAPFAATLADRHCRDHVLVGVGLVRARTLGAAAALLVAGAPSATVYASTALATLRRRCIAPPTRPCCRPCAGRRTRSRARTSCTGCWIRWRRSPDRSLRPA